MKVGLLGGTFNPLHNGHIKVALTVYEKLGLDRVIFVPSASPPHKNCKILPFKIRLELIKKSISQYPYFEVSDLDKHPDKPSYTLLLVEKMKKLNPGSEFFFIIGSDNIVQLKTWYRYENLIDSVPIVAVTRESLSTRENEWTDYSDKLIHVEMEPARISSSEIMEKLKKNKSIDEFVPKAVSDFFKSEENKLKYQ